MQETGFIKEFDGLPQTLQDWGKTAIKQIVSPEKRHEAAKEVRQRIDELWDKSFIENISAEKKEAFVLSELGDADLEAVRLAEKHRLKENPIKDRIMGVILLVISGMLSIYVYTFLSRTIDIKEYGGDRINFGVYHAGFAPGGAIFLILAFTIIGLKLIFQSRKKAR